MAGYTLRPLQRSLINNIHKTRAGGHRRLLVTAATGFGKTVCIVELIQNYLNNRPGERVCVLVHRELILCQIVEALVKQGLTPAIIQGGRHIRRSRVYVAMVQTFSRRLDAFAQLGLLPGLMLVDEAHHCCSTTYKEIISTIQRLDKSSILIGFSATPERTDGVGLREAGYTALVEGPQYAHLLAAGLLADPVVIQSEDMAELAAAPAAMANGDYSQGGETKIFAQKAVVGRCIDLYKDYFDGAPCLVFAASVTDAHAVDDALRTAGWRGGVITDNTSPEERSALIMGLGDGTYNYITSYDILSEGVDIPIVAGCIIRRRTTSLINYLQMVGRVARLCAGKVYGIIIDQCGVSAIHGHPLEIRSWSLDGAVKRRQASVGDVTLTRCPDCYVALAGVQCTCPYCGCVIAESKERTRTARAKTPREIPGLFSILPPPVQVLTQVGQQIAEPLDTPAITITITPDSSAAIADNLGVARNMTARLWALLQEQHNTTQQQQQHKELKNDY